MNTPEALPPILDFLAAIGLPSRSRSLAGPTLLPGVTIDRGVLVHDPARLAWPGDLLHEAGHIAMTPGANRPGLSGALEDDPAVAHAGEPEVTAWAFAAVTAIGLDPAILFHAGGYHGQSESLVRTYSLGVYPGLAGLVAAGMALTPAQAAAAGEPAYPAMRRWLRA